MQLRLRLLLGITVLSLASVLSVACGSEVDEEEDPATAFDRSTPAPEPKAEAKPKPKGTWIDKTKPCDGGTHREEVPAPAPAPTPAAPSSSGGTSGGVK